MLLRLLLRLVVLRLAASADRGPDGGGDAGEDQPGEGEEEPGAGGVPGADVEAVTRADREGGAFQTIWIERAKGSVGASGNYTFIDLLPAIGRKNDYRLKEVNKDGTFIYSNIAEVDFSAKLELSLTPNPAHGSVTATLNNAIGPVPSQIIDPNGRSCSNGS